MLRASLIFIMMLFMFSCKQESTYQVDEDNPLSHSTPTMIDVVGVYEGEMPCDDCKKEVVTLDLKMDKSAIATFARVGGEGGSTAGIGSWDINGEEVKVDISSGNRSYMIKGNQLQKKVGNKIYVLVKQEE